MNGHPSVSSGLALTALFEKIYGKPVENTVEASLQEIGEGIPYDSDLDPDVYAWLGC